MGQSMSRILILRDPPRSFQPLRTCLEDHHELHFVDSTEDALLSLHESQFDLIICSAHLYDSSAFSFIQTVKNHDSYRQVPLICFSGERSKAASIITKTTEHTALLVGADKYLGMDSFCASGCHETCRSCPSQLCDFETLRQEIEKLLPIWQLDVSSRTKKAAMEKILLIA
jgi:CheY-like chemotaxis protein